MQGRIREPSSLVATFPHLVVSNPSEAEKDRPLCDIWEERGASALFKLKFIPQ